MAIPFQYEKLSDFFVYAVKGLLLYHFGFILSADYKVTVFLPTAHEERKLIDCIKMDGYRIQSSLGLGEVKYEGLQTFSNSQLSVWCIELYGGIKIGGYKNALEEDTSRIWALSRRDL